MKKIKQVVFSIGIGVLFALPIHATLSLVASTDNTPTVTQAEGEAQSIHLAGPTRGGGNGGGM